MRSARTGRHVATTFPARLTSRPLALTLLLVLRAVSTIVAVALLAISASAGLQHVHAYADHGHPDHDHGPAVHAHVAMGHDAADHAAPPDSGLTEHGARFEGCDPGAHAVSVAFKYVTPQPEHPPLPVTVDVVVVAPPEHAWCRIAPSHVRAHSPPRLTDAPLRAPPVVHLA